MKALKTLKQKLFSQFRKWYLMRYENRAYRDIDELPVLLWNKIHETGELCHLFKAGKAPRGKKLNVFQAYAMTIYWGEIYDQYIKAYGFSENFLDIVRKRKEILMLRIERIVTGDRSIETFIDVCKFELEGLMKMGQGGSFLEIKAYIEKCMGIRINPMECSVNEFYGYLKYVEKQRKNLTKNG